MRDYQPKKNNPYHMPRNLYRQTLSLIRDYDRLKVEYEDLIRSTSNGEGGSSGPGDPTGALACKIESVHDRIRAIERGKKDIPQEYMIGIWKNIVYDYRYPDDADRSTYGRWKARFVYQVATYMRWI